MPDKVIICDVECGQNPTVIDNSGLSEYLSKYIRKVTCKIWVDWSNVNGKIHILVLPPVEQTFNE